MKQLIIEKILSKKFIGWLGTCILLCTGKIGEQSWFYITLLYMGFETGINIIDRLRSKNDATQK